MAQHPQQPSVAQPPPGDVQSVLQQMRETIWSRRPILGEIMQKRGDKNMYEYTKDFLDVNKSPLLDARKHEIIDMTEELLAVRVGKDVAAKVAEQLKRLPLVSTADHHATIDHPFWVNANLITAIPQIERPELNLRYLIVYSFSSVSLNNQSGYPRGMQFYGGMNGSKNVQRLPILPDKHKMSVVYATRAFTKEDLDRAKAELKKRIREGLVTEERAKVVAEIIDTYFAKKDVLSLPDLPSQITNINYAMWPKFFHPAVGEKQTSPVVPDLLYLEIETLVTQLLLKKHLSDPRSLLYRLLFDPKLKPLVRKHFNNIPGAFSVEKDWGTHFFWYIDDKQHRVRMYWNDGVVVSKQGRHTIEFTPAAIAEALRKKEIFPSMLLCYLMVSLYYGMKCLGGFCQVNDLTMTKKAFQGLLREIGEDAEADALEPVQTKELGGDGMVLTYTRTADNELIPGSGIDMLISPRDTQVSRYIARSKSVTLSEMMDPMLPEIYTVLYASTERDPAFMINTPEAILKATGLGEKLEQS